MGLVIDTNIFIDAENDRLDLEKLKMFGDYGDAYLAAVTVSELVTGIHLAKTPEIRVKRTAFVEGIIGKLQILDFSEEVARVYGDIYSQFIKPRSKRIGNVHDLQIAATAIAYGYPLLTRNTTDFNKIQGLQLMSIE